MGAMRSEPLCFCSCFFVGSTNTAAANHTPHHAVCLFVCLSIFARGHRKRKDKKEVETKKRRSKTKALRKVRLPEFDSGHNAENHMNQSESEAKCDSDQMDESDGAAAPPAAAAAAGSLGAPPVLSLLLGDP